jgi:pyruvate/2-oxoglutarate dehydrogenase complex dihydrolipoamide dehydrogenase (E3) component
MTEERNAPMQATGGQTTIDTDLCVIGAGSGGLSVAAAAAALGVPVTLIEKGAMGGDCLNAGCVPSKALIAAAKAAQAMRDAGRLGVEAQEPRVDFARVRAHVRAVIAGIAPNDEEGRFTAMGVRVLRAHGRFVAPDRVEAGALRVRARRFIVATGSAPAIPPIPGLADIPFLTNETIFDLERLPQRLCVIGGGPIGVEMAQAFRRLGAQVTLIEAQSLLSAEDPELVAPVRAALAREGVDLREETRVLRAQALDHGRARLLTASAQGQEASLEADAVLVATGRRPNLEGLGLDAAQVAHDARGVKVDASLRTSNRRVYAIGDVAGGRFTHEANLHAGLVLRATLFRLPVRFQPTLTPRVVYSDPPLAATGLTEAQARAQGLAMRVHRWPFSENDRARAEARSEGHVKILATPRGALLGVGIVGAHADEMIATWQTALTHGLSLRDMAGVTLPYPTLGEAGKRAAILHYARQAASPFTHSLLRKLRLFG